MKKSSLNVLLLILISTCLLIYFRFIVGKEGVFTHFFYIPLLLAAFFWDFWFILIVLYIAAFLIISDLADGDITRLTGDLIRSLFYFLSGTLVVLLKKHYSGSSFIKRYRGVFDSVQEAVAIIDRSFHLIMRNRKFNEIFSHRLAGSEDLRFIIRNDISMREFTKTALDCFSGQSVSIKMYIETEESVTRYFEIVLYPLIDDEKITGAVLDFRDLTGQKIRDKEQQTAIERQNIAVAALELLNMKLLQSDVITRILNLISENTGVGALGIVLNSGKCYTLNVSESLLLLLIDACNSNAGLNDMHGANIQGHFTGYDKNTIPSIKRSFRTDNLLDLLSDAGFGSLYSLHNEKFLSCTLIPLKDVDEVIGSFILLDPRSDFFSGDLVFFYEGIAQSISLALIRITYEENLNRTIAEKEGLIREVQHRVKNNMQIIISLMSLQSSRQKDSHVKEVITECQNRIRTMAVFHEKLYQSDNFTSININNYIRTLIQMLMNSYRVDPSRIRIIMDISDISINLGIAIPAAQLINEVVSNSLKHAFPPGVTGDVFLKIFREEPDSKKFTMIISDNGAGLPEGVTFPDNGNLGFQLIDVFVKQLKGRIEFTGSAGVSVRVEFSDNI